MANHAAISRKPPRIRHGIPLAIGVPAVLLGWFPVVGLLLSVAAVVVWGLAYRGRRPASALGLALGLFGLLLGSVFTGLYFALPISANRADHEVRWLSFDRLFDVEGGGGAGGAEMP